MYLRRAIELGIQIFKAILASEIPQAGFYHVCLQTRKWNRLEIDAAKETAIGSKFAKHMILILLECRFKVILWDISSNMAHNVDNI
jgi:hypothetical protein